jgi:ADP-heptose:LPS heptosyltransferase
MHIAVAMKTQLVAIFGPSPIIGFSPYDESSIVLESATPCHPCGEHHCREQKLDCMYSISVVRVLEKTLRLAKKRGCMDTHVNAIVNNDNVSPYALE